ncbi:MAG: YraN family protein [Woeseiaceae bacterium]
MVRSDKRAIGDNAESLAQRFLQQEGLTPVQRNFHCRLGELDLIMQDGNCLVVIEVRFRGTHSFVAASHTVDRRKQQKILRTTALFLAWNERFANSPVRFDVVGIDADARGEPSISWIRDAFRPADTRL